MSNRVMKLHLYIIQVMHDAEPLQESDSENSGFNVDLNDAPTDSHCRSEQRTADPASVFCGSLPAGWTLEDVIYPIEMQNSKASEAKYVVNYVDTDRKLLTHGLGPQHPADDSGSLRLTTEKTRHVLHPQKNFFEMIDRYAEDPTVTEFICKDDTSAKPVHSKLSQHICKDEKKDDLQKAIDEAIHHMPNKPLSRTCIVEAALYLLDHGILNIPDVGIINVKQAHALLWNALWLQDLKNLEWFPNDEALNADSLVHNFQLALLGPGGTGKTAVLRVTEALVIFFCGPDHVRKCAPSNAAARLLGGDTLHALCKLPFGNVSISGKRGTLTVPVLERMRKEWFNACACFIDEVSMISADRLHQSDVRMRAAKKPDRIFGGLGTILAGDFLQLPPVDPAGTSVSLATSLTETGQLGVTMDTDDTKDSEKRREKLAESLQGIQLWRRIRRVVALDVNVRAPGPLSQFLTEMRSGKISDEMWALYSSRFMQLNDPRLSAAASPFAQHTWQFIVHRHKIRVYRSLENARMNSMLLRQPLYILQANDMVVDSKHAAKMVPAVQEELLRRNNPRTTQGLPSILPLYIGMRLTLQTKDCVRLGLMKGCVCIVRHIVFAAEEQLRETTQENHVIYLTYMPIALWLQALDADWTLPEQYISADMPATTNRRGLFHIQPTYGYLKASWEDSSFTVRRTTFEVIPADTIIVYGSQGGTYDAVIADMKRPPSMDPDTHWLACYVMLSRPKSLEGLLILRPATRIELSRKPPAYLLAELDRLQQLEVLIITVIKTF